MRKNDIMMPHLVIFSVLILSGVPSNADQGLLPLDRRWEYPHYLTSRPGNGQICRVNPPRFSWPYVPQVITGQIPIREFIFQLSRTGDFSWQTCSTSHLSFGRQTGTMKSTIASALMSDQDHGGQSAHVDLKSVVLR